mgnify:CR=1 FL=1
MKYPINYNKEAIKALVRRAMDMGLYEGVNLSLAYCDDCGHEELAMDVCPVCGNIMPRDKNAAINILEEGLRTIKGEYD